MGEACAIGGAEMRTESKRVTALRDRLHQLLASQIDGISLNGHLTDRLPGNLHLSFEGVDGEALVRDLRGIAASTGSACASADSEPSHVLVAIGLTPSRARSSVRFGLGRFTTEIEIETAADAVVRAVTRLRALSPGRSNC